MLLQHGECKRLYATMLEPQHLHTVMIMLMVTIMAMIGLLHMLLTFPVLVIRMLMVMMMLMVTTCGNGWASAAGLDG